MTSCPASDPFCSVPDDVSLLQTFVSTETARFAMGELSTEQVLDTGAPSAAMVKYHAYGIPIAVILSSCIGLWLFKKGAAAIKEFQAYLCEFLGTFALVFTVTCVVIVGGHSVFGVTGIAAVLMIMIYATGPISGGHLNPSVSLSLALCGKMEWSVMLGYWVAQLTAGVSAACCVCALFAPQGASIGPKGSFEWYHAAVVEVIYTAMICFVVNNCAASKRNNAADDGNQFFALAIGFVVVAGGYAAGNISGGAFNPAVSMGLSLSSPSDCVGWGFLWCAFQVVGAAVAAGLFRICRPEDYMSEEDFSGYAPSLVTKAISEFLGTFILVLTVGLNLATGPTVHSPTAWSAAAALMCMIYSLGDVSGGHFNPSVTLAVVCSHKDGLVVGFVYWVAQVIAGLLAGLLYCWFHYAGPNKDHIIALAPANGYGLWAAGAAELVFTFVLTYVVLATACVKAPASQRTKQNFFFALAIGQSVTAGGFAIGPISGGELNPSVSIGIAIASTIYSPGALGMASSFAYVVYFVVWQLAGGVIASLVFRLTHPTEFGRESELLLKFAKYACEFVGTFVLAFTVFCNILALSPPDGVWNSTSMGAALMIMIYCTGPISGGNLNPCVSLALALCKKLDVVVMLGYWLAQLLAGLAAGFIADGLFPRLAGAGPVAPFGWYHAMILEIIFTAMICFVVNNCAASKRNNPPDDGNNFYALAIGFVVIAAGNSAGSVSGAVINPAIGIALDVTSLTNFTGWGFAWAGFELVGAALAALLFYVCRPEDYMSEDDFRSYTPSLLTRCISEFIGVFLLVLTVGLNIVLGASSTVAWSAGVTLMCMIYSLGNVSGGHFNPAVTLAVVASGRDKCSAMDGLAYFAFQIAAGLCAGLLVGFYHQAGKYSDSNFTLGQGVGHTEAEAGFTEFAFTAVLAYTVLSCATVDPASNQKTNNSFYFALCIGLSVWVGGYAIGPVSGAALNPAVSAGITISSLVSHPAGAIVADFATLVRYIVWELTGGLFAAVVFQVTHAREFVPVASKKEGVEMS